jgi:PhnB protein
MIKVNIYLNFDGKTEEAFNFYKSVFGGNFDGLQRFSEIPDFPEKESVSVEMLNRILHVALPVGDILLMGSDTMEGMGKPFQLGNNVSISIHPDSREEVERLFNL